MELPVLDKFCFVLDLKIGCISMGVVTSIFTFILLIILISFAVDIKAESEAVSALKPDGDVGMSSVVYTIMVLISVLLFIKLLLDMMLVFAVYREKTNWIKKYCIFWMVFLVLFIIGFLKALFHMDAGQVIALILYLAENFYFIVIIRSYLISLHEDGVM